MDEVSGPDGPCRAIERCSLDTDGRSVINCFQFCAACDEGRFGAKQRINLCTAWLLYGKIKKEDWKQRDKRSMMREVVRNPLPISSAVKRRSMSLNKIGSSRMWSLIKRNRSTKKEVQP